MTQFQDGARLRLERPGGGEPLTLRLSVNPRARRLSVRIDARAGEAVVIAPSPRTLPQAVDFARSRALWIAERLAARPESTPLVPGQEIWLAGRAVRLEATGTAAAARLVETEGGAILRAGGEGEAFSRRVLNFLKAEARRRLTERTEVHRAALDQAPVRLSITDSRTRWGSCSPHNRTIRYSWRVVMAPEAVLDYLAAHEVAHLVHADHSPAYWAVVQRLIGDPKPHRRWLKTHGTALHAVG
jgi:predicted metal-dependent hydrolase